MDEVGEKRQMQIYCLNSLFGGDRGDSYCCGPSILVPCVKQRVNLGGLSFWSGYMQMSCLTHEIRCYDFKVQSG